MAAGTLSYCVTMGLGFTIGGIHQILIGIMVSLLCMIIGSLTGEKETGDVLDVYFPGAKTQE